MDLLSIETELNEFTNKIKPVFSLIGILGRQNEELREARDILLGKLMSGEVGV